MRKQILTGFGLLILVSLPLLAQAADGTLPAWLEKIKLNADFRYRHELIATQRVDATTGENVAIPDRNRHRIRLRVGVNFEVNPRWDIATRLATSTAAGSFADPISTNQDLTGASGDKPFWLDRAYVDYHPLTGLNFRAGRFGMPYEGTELLWDGDLNLEGIAVSGLEQKARGAMELLGRAGGYWLQERSGTGSTKQDRIKACWALRVECVTLATESAARLCAGYDVTARNLKDGPVR